MNSRNDFMRLLILLITGSPVNLKLSKIKNRNQPEVHVHQHLTGIQKKQFVSVPKNLTELKQMLWGELSGYPAGMVLPLPDRRSDNEIQTEKFVVPEH